MVEGWFCGEVVAAILVVIGARSAVPDCRHSLPGVRVRVLHYV